jgi:hypothetical protein
MFEIWGSRSGEDVERSEDGNYILLRNDGNHGDAIQTPTIAMEISVGNKCIELHRSSF